MSFLCNAQGVKINGGQFLAATTWHSHTYLSSPTGIDILRGASASEATHDSSARLYSPRCFPGTREQYIEDIVGRATPSLGGTSLPMYWMKGPAGVGKSAIAQTCAEQLQVLGALGASFFFSINGQRKSEKLFLTIAYQLSTVHPAYRELVDSKLRCDKTLVDKAMRFQFRYLIDEPLRELEDSGKGIRRAIQVLIDGLDECEEIDAQCEIIRIVGAAASDGTLPLQWTFFSRPEPHIEASFSKADVTSNCYKAILPISRDADGEIELYLRNAFDNIIQHRNPSVKALWPSTKEMDLLVRGAGGSFIYATTIVRFVNRPNLGSPRERLLAVIDVIRGRRYRARSDAPFAELDAFYGLILQRVPMEISPSVHLLLALLGRPGSLGAMLAANLLGISKDEFETVCHHVGAVVHFEDPGQELELDPTIDTSRTYTQVSEAHRDTIFEEVWDALGGRVSFYHKSFFDFLLDPARSNTYCVAASELLAKNFVSIHLRYDQSFSWCGSELALSPDVPDSAALLSYPYTNELVNSSLVAWVYAWASDEDPDHFPTPQAGGGLGVGCDFRKYLYTRTTMFAGAECVYSRLLWGCEAQRKYFQGAYVEHILNNRFSQSTIAGFKLMIKWRERTGIVQRYHPTLTSKIRSIFRDKSREGVESALYRMGNGDKAIFWYWEINHRLKYYREFRSVDLTMGERIFREEDFDSWPEYSYADDD